MHKNLSYEKKMKAWGEEGGKAVSMYVCENSVNRVSLSTIASSYYRYNQVLHKIPKLHLIPYC